MYKTILVKIDDLLLNPNNPRFSSYFENEIPENQIETRQKDTLERMCESRVFEVDELIEAIKNNGFNPVAKIFVKSLGNKYLVLEGNRRVSAVKYLLMKHNKGLPSDILPKNILDSMVKLEVNDLTDLDNDKVRQIIAIIHLGGAKEWRPLPAAYNIYREYMRELAKDRKQNLSRFIKNHNNFIYNAVIAKKIKDELTISLAQVRNSVKIYRAHLQLMEISHSDSRVADENNYSMIGDTIKDETLHDYFGFDDNRGVFSDEGAEKFLDLCLIGNDREDRVITAPASGDSSLRDFSKILSSASATDEDIRRVVVERKPAGLVLATVRSREDIENLHAALSQALKILEGVELGMVKTSGGLGPAEERLIKKIEERLEQLKKASS